MTRPCEWPECGARPEGVCKDCPNAMHATDAHPEKVPAHNAPQPKDGRDTGTRVLEGPRGLTLVKLTTEQAIAAQLARDPHLEAMGPANWHQPYGPDDPAPETIGQGWYLVYREAGSQGPLQKSAGLLKDQAGSFRSPGDA